MRFEEQYRKENESKQLTEVTMQKIAGQMTETLLQHETDVQFFETESGKTRSSLFLKKVGAMAAAAAMIGLMVSVPLLWRSREQARQEAAESQAASESEDVTIGETMPAITTTTEPIHVDHARYDAEELVNLSDLIVFGMVEKVEQYDEYSWKYHIRISRTLLGEVAEGTLHQYGGAGTSDSRTLEGETLISVLVWEPELETLINKTDEYLFFLEWAEAFEMYRLTNEYQVYAYVPTTETGEMYSVTDDGAPILTEVMVECEVHRCQIQQLKLTQVEEERKMNNDICNHTYFQAQAQGQEYGNTAAVAEYINRMMLYDMALPHGVDFSSVIAEDEALLCWLIQQSAGAICREQERIAATGQEIAFLGGTADWLEGELQNTVSPDIRLPQGVRYERLIQNCDGLQYDGDGVLCLSGMAPDSIAAELAVSETILYYAVPVVYEYDGLLYAPAHKYILERESSDCTLRGKVYDGGTSECMGTFEVMSDGTIDMVTDSFVPTTEVFVLEEDAESELGYYLETVCS